MSAIDPQEIVYVIYIDSTPEKVWAALTRPELTQQYFFGRRVESNWLIGSPFLLKMADGRIDTRGEVLECERLRRLTVSWRVEWLEELQDLPEAIVSYQIYKMGEVVRLTITESHPEPVEEEILEGGRRGWPVILSGLKTLLETGHPLPDFDPSA